MAGKTLDELKAACIVHYKAKRKTKDKKKGVSKFTFTPAGRAAFTVEGDSDVLAAYISSLASKVQGGTVRAEFAGLTADYTKLAETESLEVNAWVTLEEEPRARVDWKEYTKSDRNETTLSSITTSFNIYPFYLDSSATTYITPELSDFISLQTIPHRAI